MKLETSQDEPKKKRKLNDTDIHKDILINNLINNLRNENNSLNAEAESKLPSPTTKTPATPEFATMMKELKSDRRKGSYN